MANHMGSKRAAHVMTFGNSNIPRNNGISSKTAVKHPLDLERAFKGVSNHYRISILFCVAKEEGMTLDQLAQLLDINFRTISDHTKKLVHAGLLQKKYVGLSVAHSLTPQGRKVYDFLKSF